MSKTRNHTTHNPTPSRSANAPSVAFDPDNSILGLSAIRRSKGISLEQIASQTKIGVRALRAIEEGNFDKLPGGIYSTSYIRQYARSIDFDESELLAYYYSKTGIPASGGAGSSPTASQDRTLALGDLRRGPAIARS